MKVVSSAAPLPWVVVIALLGCSKSGGTGPSVDAAPAAEASRDALPSPIGLAENPGGNPEATVLMENWFAAKDAETQAALIYRADINRTEFLKRTTYVRPSKLDLDLNACGPRPMDGGCQMMLGSTASEPRIFWLRVTPSGYRVDWKATFEVNPMSMVAYQASMPTQPSVWRLNGKLATYFNYEFMNKQSTHYSVRLSEPGTDLKAIHAYAEKSSPEGAALFKALNRGETENVTVAIAFPETRRSNEIVRLVAFYGTDFRETAEEIAATAKWATARATSP